MSSVPILASTGPLFGRPLRWSCGVIRQAGYDGVELMVTQDPETQDPVHVGRISQSLRIPVPVVHGPFLLLTRRVFGTDLVEKARRSLEFASALGSDLMIVHPPFRWQRGFHQWLLERGDKEAAALDTRIGVENLYPIQLGSRLLRLHRYTEPEHLAPFRHVVLDTSHFGVAGVDINAAYDRLADATVHLHVSDYRGAGRDSHAPLGHGILPLARFLRTAGQDRDFTGSITLELDCRRYLDDRSALVGYLAQEREKCLALMEGSSAEEVLGRPDEVTAVPSGWTEEEDADQPTVPPL